MHARGALVGRTAESARLAAALERAAAGEGALVLLSGEAGVGKTRLMGELDAPRVLRGAAASGTTTPYGPIAAALRSHLRQAGEIHAGGLRPHLAVLLPELGDPAPGSDRATLVEAVRRALAEVAPALVILDDLQWSDEATLGVLAGLAPALAGLPVLIIAAYRSDGLPRDHLLRWLRNELRRGGHLEELQLAPLDRGGTAALAAAVLGEPPSPALAAALHDRTQGVPFFVEELARALHDAGRLQPGPKGLELGADGEVPVPDTVRDAVLLGAWRLSDRGREAAEAAAVAGEAFDLELVGGLASEEGVAELIRHGVAHELGDGRAAFRHALAREAFYVDVPWLRRRALHREIAGRLAGPALEVATHWLGAREAARARAALVRAVADSEAVYAYGDAASAGRQALELWPGDEDPAGRIDVLERYARCAELAGELAEAVRAWRELASVRRGDPPAAAGAHRRLAAVYERKGERESAFAARRAAADAFAAAGRSADAAVERLAMANHRRMGAAFGEAMALAGQAAEEAGERTDLRARAMGLQGVARAKRGEFDAGLDMVRAGLALALEHDHTGAAAELYQRLGLVLYDSADYRRAEQALDSALDLCRVDGDAGTRSACETCLVYVLRERGEWARARELAAALEGSDSWVVDGLVGVIDAFQGRLPSARRLLSSSLATSGPLGHFHMWVDATAGLAYAAAAEGAGDEAAEHCRALLARWDASEDHHDAVWGLHWAASFLAGRGDRAGAHACADALMRIAAASGHAYSHAALAHALGEAALLAGDADAAAEQLTRAVELHRGLDVPFERAHVQLRAGVALAAAGERDPALEHLADAYRTARKLGARPLASAVAGEVAALGGSVTSHATDDAGLTRRELEVVRRIAVGRTNRDVAQELFLSPRTVDMHVRNILRKLGCRSRVEAAYRAGELGLLG